MELQDIVNNIVIKKVGQYLEADDAYFYTGELLFKVEARFDEVDEEKDLPFIKQQLAEILFDAIYKNEDGSLNNNNQDLIQSLYEELKNKEQIRINMVSELEYLRRRVEVLERQKQQ